MIKKADINLSWVHNGVHIEKTELDGNIELIRCDDYADLDAKIRAANPQNLWPCDDPRARLMGFFSWDMNFWWCLPLTRLRTGAVKPPQQLGTEDGRKQWALERCSSDNSVQGTASLLYGSEPPSPGKLKLLAFSAGLTWDDSGFKQRMLPFRKMQHEVELDLAEIKKAPTQQEVVSAYRGAFGCDPTYVQIVVKGDKTVLMASKIRPLLC